MSTYHITSSSGHLVCALHGVSSGAAKQLALALQRAGGKKLRLFHGRPSSNPTLVHHRLAKAASHHLVTRAGQAVADFYGMSEMAAKRAGRRLARLKGQDLQLLVNRSRPRRLADHPARTVRTPLLNARARAHKRRVKKLASSRRSTRRNPAGQELERAKKTFRMWHGFSPSDVQRVRMNREIPSAMVKLGEVKKIVYRSSKWSGKAQDYEHTMKPPYPSLSVGASGRPLLIHGGTTRVSPRGLIERGQ
jgi:hypothetical protein